MTTASSYSVMCRFALFLFQNQSYRMTRSSQNRTGELIQVNILVFWMNNPLQWLTCDIKALDIFIHSFIWFWMIYLRQLSARETMIVQLRRYTVIFLISINIGTPKRSLEILEISFIGRQPFTMSGQMSRSVMIVIKS